MIFILTVAAYLLAGALTSLIWARGYWQHGKTQELIKKRGYEHVANEARTMRAVLVIMWPFLLPWMLFLRMGRALDIAYDPHIEHRRQYQENLENYTSLRRLEIEVHGSSNASKPEIWCACLEGLDKG
jgi:hypothetical protein